ncbi:CBS domain-containing protein [Cerasibacillus terrae]|uniref:CBS domain-containing protein n=1 Tax=Cerasibacillus terrae TaxID=2498845 RepID=A0A5C8P0T2_9BACI|nr:cyclic di-AMP binding protein CbpA [Cerasibacillus terrae]TXL66835.1 CBS domain-containing protein [Cerasibacillus terrae]
MLVKNDYVNKNEVVFVKEKDNMKEVMKTLADSGYRCIPVLDERGEKYVGNVYKVHLLKHEKEHSLDGPLDELIADRENSSVKENDAFFKVFKSIKQLPFLAVVDEEKHFQGILTNGNVIQVLENAWGVHNGSYSLTIGTIEYAGALQKMLRIINEYCNVQSVISLNNNSLYVRRVCIVLPEEVDEKLMKQVVKALENHNLTITDIEKLN